MPCALVQRGHVFACRHDTNQFSGKPWSEVRMPENDFRPRYTLGVLANFQMYDGTLSSYFQPILRGLQTAARRLDCNLLIASGVSQHTEMLASSLRPAWPVRASDSDFLPVGPWNTDGLLVFPPFRSSQRQAYIQRLIADGFPVVFIGHSLPGRVVLPDNADGVRDALQHLMTHGHREIVFLASWPELKAEDERLTHYGMLSREYNLPYDERRLAYGGYTTPGGYRAMQQVLASGVSFTAILAGNDESAIGVIQALHDAGLHVPQDIAVVGFDDRLEAIAQHPPLTTVHFPLYETGYRSVHFLLDTIAGRTAKDQIMRLPTTLVVRQSCGCQPGEWQSLPYISSMVAAERRTQLQSSLAQSMVATLLAHNQSILPEELYRLCWMLVDSFLSGMELGQSVGFQNACRKALERVEATDSDPHSWQSAFSMLRRWVPLLISALIPPEAEVPASMEKQAEDLLHQARIAVSESAQRRDYRHILQEAAWSEREGVLTARLLASLSEAQILAALDEHLPGLGIQKAHVFFFEPDGDDPLGISRLGSSAPPERFVRVPSHSFPPREIYPETVAYQLVLLPLVFQDEEMGFVAFETERMESCSIVARQVAAAFRNVRLHQEAAEGRRLAEEANRLKSRFLATVSHELRTPISFIVGMTDMLLRTAPAQHIPDDSSYSTHTDLKKIHASAEHLGLLIRDVLDLASSEAGQLRLMPQKINLSNTLRMVAETGVQLAEAKGLEWHAQLPHPGPWVWGDVTRLRQVALNLVANAVKFTARGKVSLKLEMMEDQVRVIVSDTGLGILPMEQAAIFDEFRQSERTATRGYGGLGLGLAICKRLIELHGGKMGVESSGVEGQGARFYFTLPRIQSPLLAQSPDSHQVLLFVVPGKPPGPVYDYLMEQGFQVKVNAVEDWDVAMETILLTLPAAIILDTPLAATRGWETLRLLKGHPGAQDIPILFYDLPAGAETGILLELDSLTKPVGTSDMKKALTRQGVLDTKTSKTILVVDDEPNVLELHVRVVQELAANHRVLQARNGLEAMNILRSTVVDLVMLDLMMPEMDGFAVLEAMRSSPALREIPVIVLSAQLLTEADMVRLNRGVTSVLSKGVFSVAETLAHLDAVLQRAPRLGTEAQRIVRKAVAFIQSNAAEPLSRAEIASYVGVSESYLSHSFQQEMRIPLMTYLSRHRIHLAKNLLVTTSLSLSEIASQVGFSSEIYFNRVFRREAGVPPGAYRQGRRPPASFVAPSEKED